MGVPVGELRLLFFLKGLISFTSVKNSGAISTNKSPLGEMPLMRHDFQMGSVKLRSNEAFKDDSESQMER